MARFLPPSLWIVRELVCCQGSTEVDRPAAASTLTAHQSQRGHWHLSGKGNVWEVSTA